MTSSTSNLTTALSALVIACAMVAFTAQPAAAQTAGNVKNLKCKGCVDSKDIKNNSIRSKDIRNGQVKNADLANNAVTLDKLGSDVTALGLEGVAVIGAADFHGESGIDFNDWIISTQGFIASAADPALGCVVAPVHLPDAVTITEMELVFVDDSTSDFSILLRRASLLDGSVSDLAFVTTAGVDDSALMRLSDTSIAQPIVDTVDFTYWIKTDTCLRDFNSRLYAVRIFYE